MVCIAVEQEKESMGRVKHVSLFGFCSVPLFLFLLSVPVSAPGRLFLPITSDRCFLFQVRLR